MMAKKARKGFNLTEYTRDITVNDFANSSVAKTGRVKKNEINSVISQVKKLSIAKNEQPWDEKLKYLNANRPQNKNNPKKTLKGRRRRAKMNITETKPDENSTRNHKTYPIELWFKVSEFIAPEDVGKFASICSNSLAVVSTARFWHGLYQRHYKEVPDLPELLQPQCIVRKYGLRANVIRALYFMYPPFINKLKAQSILDGDPHTLVKRVCVLSWSQKKKNHWLFCFKLKRSQPVNFGRQDSENEWKPGLLERLEDINANLDEDCKMLEVKTVNYVPLPMISGQRLNGVLVTLSEDFQYQRLELNFGCGTSPHMGNNYVTLDSVLKIRIIDWWHPSFPHSNSLSCTSHFNENSYLMDEIDGNVI